MGLRLIAIELGTRFLSSITTLPCCYWGGMQWPANPMAVARSRTVHWAKTRVKPIRSAY